MADKTKSVKGKSLFLDGDVTRQTSQPKTLLDRTEGLPRDRENHLTPPEEMDLDQELFEADMDFVRTGADRLVSRFGTMLFKIRAQEERILKAEEDRDQWRKVVDAMVGNDEVTGSITKIEIPKWPLFLVGFGIGMAVATFFFIFSRLSP